ncbi:MAG TPA: PPOX class F420-dependent oxidoreductase [Dermatophilaceae bacterium]|nr:PPOX class F420-dependent oxidoreductase [Dermatophilaceae bacterium]
MTPHTAEHPLAGEEFVSLTTFRRIGQPVSSPVWIAPSPSVSNLLLVTTLDGSGKVKRLAHTERVELRACDRRGRVAEDAPTYHGTGRVVRDSASVEALLTAVRGKYAIYRVLGPVQAMLNRLRSGAPRVGIQITMAG